jgi:spore germination cell wall hydrolase CwlJ-like protein
LGVLLCLHLNIRDNWGAVLLIASTCLALAIYFEARGESVHGQRMISRVIVNRMQSDKFPNDMCDVIMQPRQFSFIKKGKIPKPRDKRAWVKAQALAVEILKDTRLLPYSKADHYHATYVQPFWRNDLYKITQVGQHIFYSRYHPMAIKISLRPKQRPKGLARWRLTKSD